MAACFRFGGVPLMVARGSDLRVQHLPRTTRDQEVSTSGHNRCDKQDYQ